MKMMVAALILASFSTVAARSTTAYPNGNVAEFVVEKLEVKSLPAAIQPKTQKGKKTLSDYGYVTEKIDSREAVLKAPQGTSEIALNVLEESPAGIYVCVSGKASDRNAEQIQRVYLLRAKNGDGLLRGREASKEFAGCPVVGGQTESGGD